MGDLFDGFDADPGDAHPTPPAQWHSPTSVEAAEAVEPRAATLRRLVLDYLRGRGPAGATDEEGIDATGLPSSTYRPRRIELWRAGFVADSGTTRLTRAQRRAVVWIAAEAHHAAPAAS